LLGAAEALPLPVDGTNWPGNAVDGAAGADAGAIAGADTGPTPE